MAEPTRIHRPYVVTLPSRQIAKPIESCSGACDKSVEQQISDWLVALQQAGKWLQMAGTKAVK